MGKSFRTLILAMAMVLAAAVSCTESLPEVIKEDPQDSKSYLQISSVSTSELTKSAIEGAKFPTAEAAIIGLFLGGTSYTDAKYTNVRYAKPAGSDSWTDPQIELQSAEATVYGYYPYSEDVTSISSIPVASSVDGDDWMWATPVEKVSSSNPEISLSMNHALALVEVTFNITGYDASEKITNITLTGASFSAGGTLDATTGTLTPGTDGSTSTELSNDVELSQTDGKIVAKCLLVPTRSGTDADKRQDLKVSITIGDKNNGGKTLSATLSGDSNGVIVRQGTKSTVSLNVKGTTMELASVGVSDWNGNVVSGSTATVDGHTVTVSGTIPVTLSLNGASSLSGEENETISESLSISYDKSSLSDGKYGVEYACDKTGACIISHNADAGTITVSKVTADVTITLTKKVNWYDVTLTTEGNGTAYIGTPGTTSARCNAGGSITLTATPEDVEDFIGWHDENGTSLSTDKSYTYTPSADIAIKAVFTTRILSGVFTVGVDANGNATRKARFSGGNLWYDGSKFLFEAEQYQSTPSSNIHRTEKHISHFMWCSLATYATALTYAESSATSLFTEADDFTPYATGGWYAPNHSEVQCLLHDRNASTICGVENARWFKGRINTSGSTYVNGLFLIPDVFTWPESVTTKPESSINVAGANYSAASFSLAEFKALEKAGIVFLPAAGSRNGSEGSASVSNVNAEGFYWVSGRQDGMIADVAEEVHFTSSKFYPGKTGTPLSDRYIAHSVRLLIDVTE